MSTNRDKIAELLANLPIWKDDATGYADAMREISRLAAEEEANTRPMLFVHESGSDVIFIGDYVALTTGSTLDANIRSEKRDEMLDSIAALLNTDPTLARDLVAAMKD
jgi:hypothetical protein